MHRSSYQVLMSFGNKQWVNINEFLRKRSFMLEFMQRFVPLHPIQYSIEYVYIEMIYVMLYGSTNMPMCKCECYSKLFTASGFVFVDNNMWIMRCKRNADLSFWRFISSKDGIRSTNSQSQCRIFYRTMKMKDKMKH